MIPAMKIALAQINPVVGDVDGNTAKILAAMNEASTVGADIVLVPELAVVGYPPKDMLLKRALIERNLAAVKRIAEAATDVAVVVGHVARNNASEGKGLLNAASVCHRGEMFYAYAKRLLPTYDVFDESRYFDSGSTPGLCALDLPCGRVKLGLTICEDIWTDDLYFSRRLYRDDPVADVAAAGAEFILNIGSSPFAVGKPQRRMELFRAKAKQVSKPLIYVNQVGGNDDLVFDGASGAVDAKGQTLALCRSFGEDFALVDLDANDNRISELPEGEASIYGALVLGTRDYVKKCGFEHVVIGVSGGIDSAVTAAIAVAALGKDRVHCVAMPSRFSSRHSLEDAEALAKALDTDYRIIPIEDIHAATEGVLQTHFDGTTADVTEENIQARARGSVLMALSNKFGWLLLTTGNKSEIAVGYCTMYGDMCGGLAVLSDVPKTMVYRLANYINERAGAELIPERTMTKPPSAELRENQTDQDSLPPYDVLDEILERYVERQECAKEITAAGFDEDTVRDVIRKVDRNEYKRQQAATGIKVTSRAFGSGWRMPIAARYL